VDWYLDEPGEAARLRHQIGRYLERHAAPGADIAGAELIVSELIANALRHAQGAAWVSLTWLDEHPVLQVADLGPGFAFDPQLPDDPTQPGGRGLYVVSRLAVALEARARAAGGSIVTAELPLARAPEISHDAPVHRSRALPALDEALPTGAFGRESFLRALIVQLAQAVDEQVGPDAAASMVAQVGADVGGQMELEYREAKRIVGRMTPEAIGDCYVRLKHAIDGQFTVEEATPERIVLVNTRCPFGDVVQRAPALCRMTSSVFGGIAARNSEGGATVLLEERIAIGDPQCRVVVRFDGEHSRHNPHAHRYERPRGLDDDRLSVPIVVESDEQRDRK
jgi:anti-sigma regulatory factor (Ser/Thr protein kinase)